jgi:hypothetical protein
MLLKMLSYLTCDNLVLVMNRSQNNSNTLLSYLEVSNIFILMSK